MLPVLDDKLLTRYLLGDLAEADQAQVEAQLFADETCYDRLCALQAELTDQYVRGSLSPKAQQAFAQRFLTTATGREDELFARALHLALREEREARQPVVAPSVSWREKLAQYFQFPAWQMAMTAAMVLLVVGVFWLLFETQRLRQQLAGAQTEAQQAARTEAELAEQLRRARTRNEELDQLSRTAQQERDQARQELERLSARPSPGSMLGTMLSLLLAPGAGRGSSQVDELTLTPQAQQVQLRLLLDAGTSQASYRAELRTKQGDLLRTLNRLPIRSTKDGQAAQLTLPTSLLQDGTYVVSLYGVQSGQAPELINHYDFKIKRGK